MYKTLHKKQGSVTVQLRFARSSVTFCAPRDKISCRFVRLNITLLLIFVKSFGTVTYAISNLLSARNVIFKTGDSIEKPFVIYPPLQMAGNRRGGWTLVNHHIRVKAHSPQGVHAV